MNQYSTACFLFLVVGGVVSHSPFMESYHNQVTAKSIHERSPAEMYARHVLLSVVFGRPPCVVRQPIIFQENSWQGLSMNPPGSDFEARHHPGSPTGRCWFWKYDPCGVGPGHWFCGRNGWEWHDTSRQQQVE